MKIFQILLKNCAAIGVIPVQNHQTHQFNMRNITVLFLHIPLFTSNFVYILLKAETFSDFIEYFYNCVSTITSMMSIAVVIVRMRELLRLILNFEKCINNRE